MKIKNPSLTLLLVDDSVQLQRTLPAQLRHHGFEVISSVDSQSALETIASCTVDIIVLEVELSGTNGLELLKHLRAQGDCTLVLVLSGRNTVDDRIAGLDAGADDYLTKPFCIDELIARLNAISRNLTHRTPIVQRLCKYGLELDVDSFKAAFDGRDLLLTRTEFRLLEILIGEGGRSLTHEALMERLYGYEARMNRNTVEAHISTLRRKLTRVGAPMIIHTRRGFGYFVG